MTLIGTTGVRPDRNSSDCHTLLLRMAGRLPNPVLTKLRTWLAAGDVTRVAVELTRLGTAARGELTAENRALLAALLVVGGADIATLAGIGTASAEPDAPYKFAPASERVLQSTSARIAPLLDLTSDADLSISDELVDAVDRVATAEAGRIPGILGLWRSWRFADAGPGLDSEPCRVYLVEVGPETAPWAIAASFQSALAAAGETAPQVEAFTEDSALAAYQAKALRYSALLWASTPPTEIFWGDPFDLYSPQGTGLFQIDHPHLEDPEDALTILDYLGNGVVLYDYRHRLDDVVDPVRDNAVPLTMRTDGVWVWRDTSLYYLLHHRLSPPTALVEHIRQGHTPPTRLDRVAAHRVKAFLDRRSASSEPTETPTG